MVHYFIITWAFMIARYGVVCDIPKFHNIDIFDDCFQGAKGWYSLNSQCLFPLTQFERNATVAIQMCGAVNHSSGYRETNWLIAKKIQQIFSQQAQAAVLQKIYWTGLRIMDTHTMGVESQDATIGSDAVLANFTSIYNPLWAKGQPPQAMPDYMMLQSCVALDLRNDEMFGWRVLPCETQLPVLCQNYACKSGYFRCEDNSRCIPPEFRYDGFDDCLDGSDEKTVEPVQSNSVDQTPFFTSPVSFSSSGTLSPTTIRYGRGGCIHQWTIISPNNRTFAIQIEWLNTLSNAKFKIEGLKKEDVLQLDSRNKSRIMTSFTSFIMTAENADTRKSDFLVHYSEIDDSACKISNDGKIRFNSATDAIDCDIQYNSKDVSDYSVLLIRQCSSSTPFVANIIYNNSTFSLQPSQSQKLLIIPSSQFSLHINSSWPNPSRNLEVQTFRLPNFEAEHRKLDIFITETKLDVQWLSTGKYESISSFRRDLSINMMITNENQGLDSKMDATWRVEKLGRNVFTSAMSNSCVQLISSNSSRLISSPCTLLSSGPTTLFFNQITSSFEFHGIYSLSTSSSSNQPNLNPQLDFEITTQPPSSATSPEPITRCKLPTVFNGYIRQVDHQSSLSYGIGTKVFITCSVGYTQLEQELTITCQSSGEWATSSSTIQDNTVICSPIICSEKTVIEQVYSLVPTDGGSSRNYGATRKYQNWPFLNFGPFCVCGENQMNPSEWSCYNDGKDPMHTYATACITPQIKNGKFDTDVPPNHKFNVHPIGTRANLTCYFCSEKVHPYTCKTGLWENETGTLIDYREIDCDEICAKEGWLKLLQSSDSNSCGPHGKPKVFPDGRVSCICDSGFKLTNGICQDIDECYEGISLCDPTAECSNFEGGYQCLCPESTELLLMNNTVFTDHTFLLVGLSCVEVLCDFQTVKQDLALSSFDLIYPPSSRRYFFETEPSGNIFATDVCGGNSQEPCVVQFSYFCGNSLFVPFYDITKNCYPGIPDLDVVPKSRFPYSVFGVSTTICHDKDKILIGRPDIFCNVDMKWDTLPICVQESCSDLSQFVNGTPHLQIASITPYSNQPGSSWLTKNTVHFGCDVGYVLRGYESTTCLKPEDGSDPQWVPSVLPTCVQLGTTTPKTLLDEGIIVENSAVFEETDILHPPYTWTKTSDWEWTAHGCLVHSYSHPISFLLTSTSIFLDSDEIELVVDLSQCSSNVQIAIHSSDDGFIPPISEFLTVMTTSSSGSAVVTIRNLQSFLAVSISANGYVSVCGVKIRQRKCREIDFGELHLKADRPMKFNRFIGATCNNRPTQVTGRCDARKGWVIQNPNCCTVRPCPQLLVRDETQSTCNISSCANGVCVQLVDTFYCRCNKNFTTNAATNQSCVPDHCAHTNLARTSGYNCTTGKEDLTVTCKSAGKYGDFCQFQGRITNKSVETYLLDTKKSQNLAINTNVCDNTDTYYAIPDSKCSQSGSTTSFPNSFCGSCQNFTSCMPNFPFFGGTTCACDEGYYGRRCDVSTFCLSPNGSYNCQYGATCSPQLQECKCADGFTGKYCEQTISYHNCTDAISKNCQNGECSLDPSKTPYCNCNQGYIKDQSGICNVPFDGCALNNPCQQNGVCQWSKSTGSFSCDCSKTDGWSGVHCEVPPDALSCDDCNSGHSLGCLTQFPGELRCECAVGYKENNCDARIDDCAFNPCFNNGTCQIYDHLVGQNLVESYNCSCSTGFSGTNCEIVLNRHCQDFIKCENGGTCEFDKDGNAICVCAQQYYGTNCEKSCSDICAHADGCRTENGSVWCNCFEGYSSQYCDVMDDVCKGNMLTCRNGGTCDAKNQTCHCDVAKYGGRYCEVDKNQCVVNLIKCQNGGICEPTSGICDCPPSFNGEFCENEIDFCMNTMCYNGGSCVAKNSTCMCPPGTTGDHCQNFGQPCMMQLPDGSMTDYCLNGGKCFELPEGAACDCGGTDYTGRRCEIRITFNFNLVFNGMQYSPQIVSNVFSNSSAREFTVCSFVQYNYNSDRDSSSIPSLPPYLAMRSYTGSNQQIVFDNLGFHMCDDQKTCVTGKSENNFKRVPITPNTWHHFCLISPAANEVTPTYSAYLDGVKVVEQYADRFDPAFYGYLILAPADLAPRDHLFQGMISMTQMYVVRLNDSQIGRLAFDCFQTISKDVDMQRSAVLKWDSNFTRVSAVNPGVSVDPAGICSSVKCMFGRQVKGNNYNSTGSCEKDRLPPTVFRCPNSQYRVTTEDYAKVEWSDEDVSFFDNIGVVRIETNFHNGQQFGIGISTVRYVAFDAAGNSAECSFDIAVTKKVCPSLNQIVIPNGKIEFIPNAGTFSPVAAVVKCDDPEYPNETHPKFYACDIMGSYKDGSWADENEYYYLPACGKTTKARQLVNGTVVGSGTCSEMSLKLRDTLWKSVNCDVLECKLRILPPCGEPNNNQLLTAGTGNTALQYELLTGSSPYTISQQVSTALQKTFNFVSQDATVSCNSSYPIHVTNENSTFCVSCPEGSYADIAANECTLCPINTYRNSSSLDQRMCDKCLDGETTGDHEGAVDASQCYVICPIGQYADITTNTCKPCGIGSYGSSAGLLNCTSCGFDLSTENDGSTSSSDCSVTCPAGQQMVRENNIPVPVCVNCAKGYYKESDRGACIQCPRGLTTTVGSGAKSKSQCDSLNCIDLNTMKNPNVTAGPNVPYSELCLTCAQGSFQNTSNADHCYPCTELSDDAEEMPVTCQSTCSPAAPTDGCNCQFQTLSGKNASIFRNCLPEVKDAPSHGSAIAIALPVVFGVVILIALCVAFFFRKQIIAWFRKTEQSDNQNVSPGFWSPRRNSDTPRPTRAFDLHSTGSQRSIIQRRVVQIPRPNLRIVTNRAELDQLPPLPSSSTPSLHADSNPSVYGSRMIQNLTTASSNRATVGFEANGSPKYGRQRSSSGSSLDSFF